MVALGLFVRAWAAGQLQKNKELTVSGPYAFTRNPLYLGSFLIGIGVTLAGGLPLFTVLFLVFFLLVYWRTMDSERAHLTDQFGDRYRHYHREVPLFIPRVRPYRPPPDLGQQSTSFAFDRYFRNKEWEAALGAGLAFAFLASRAAGLF
ncbi:MAG: methyltransferase family protein [Longimicrobiales bacterium]